MSRPENVAVAGYVPTSDKALHYINSYLGFFKDNSYRDHCIVDPCAGEGQALRSIKQTCGLALCTYTCELEQTRSETLQKVLGSYHNRHWQGDAFKITWKGHAGLLWLNPPYDVDKEYKRLEERFLQRFAPILAPNGLLVYLIPYYALSASVKTLAKHFSTLECFRFPEEEWGYKQVALFGIKRDIPASDFALDQNTIAQINQWASNPDEIPPLSEQDRPRYQVPTSYMEEWKLKPFDITGLISVHKPWSDSKTSTVKGFVPDRPLLELCTARYTVATVPRPAHVAAGIAAGIFNGVPISGEGLPTLLVKGIFQKEWHKQEEKTNAKGEITSTVVVQKPKLLVTTLNLETRQFQELSTAHESEGSIAYLIKHYGPSLAEAMEKQCQIQFRPQQNNIPLKETNRTLYPPQINAAKACLNLINKGVPALLLGEVGVGKTSVAQTVAHSYGAKRILVLCPPHLLSTWEKEIQAVLPWTKVKFLFDPSDVDSLAGDNTDTIIAVLSREDAKLGHAFESVSDQCPKCFALLPNEDLAKKRLNCQATKLIPIDDLAKVAQKLAFDLRKYAPNENSLISELTGKTDFHKKLALKSQKIPWDKPKLKSLYRAVDILRNLEKSKQGSLHEILAILQDDNLTYEIAKASLAEEAKDRSYAAYDSFALELAFLLKPKSKLQIQLFEEGKSHTYLKHLFSHAEQECFTDDTHVKRTKWGFKEIEWANGKLRYDKREASELDAYFDILRLLSSLGTFQRSPVCGEFLYQSVPKPRRVSLVKYIQKRHKKLFDFLIVDEAHEYSGDGSAQEKAAHRLMDFRIPTILMTGSIMNGYAESLFTNFWYISRSFREEFPEREGSKSVFVERYGYLKKEIREGDTSKPSSASYGAVTDRVEKSERIIGKAPGILPVFLFRHLLSQAVTLQIEDFDLDLPKCTDDPRPIIPSPEQKKHYDNLVVKLKAALKRDRFTERSGQLFGALSELPSYLDLAFRDYTVAYPDGTSVTQIPRCEGELPKETWLCKTVQDETTQGFKCLVLVWHTELLPYVGSLLSRKLGIKVEVLDVEKVSPKKREDWIDKKVITKNVDVLVCNPVGIQTGLNNLRYFNRLVWYENPGCKPIVSRQTIGRIRRIGQTVATKSIFAYYEDTLQENLYQLLTHKVGVSQMTDGLDPDASLYAIGAVDETFDTSLSIGKYLYKILMDE